MGDHVYGPPRRHHDLDVHSGFCSSRVANGAPVPDARAAPQSQCRLQTSQGRQVRNASAASKPDEGEGREAGQWLQAQDAGAIAQVQGFQASRNGQRLQA